MKAALRNHPKMKFGGGIASSWPPQCGGSHRTGTPYHTGEQGILKRVEFFPADRSMPDRLWVTIEYLGNSSSGALTVDDASILGKLKDFLQSHIGEELSVIGGLEIDFD
jgi:hypothetical protein